MTTVLPPGLVALKNVHLDAIRRRLSVSTTQLSERATSTRYIFLCFTNRCGSNYLAQILASAGSLNTANEFFNGETVTDNALSQQLDDFAGYFNYLVDQVGKSNVLVSKAAPAHLVVLSELGILDQIIEASTFIALERANKLDQAISLEIADQSGRWSDDQTPRQPDGDLIFNRSKIQDVILGLTYQQHLFDQFYALNGITPFILSFETLRDSPELVVAQLSSFLKLDLRYVASAVTLKPQRREVYDTWRQLYLGSKQGENQSVDQVVGMVSGRPLVEGPESNDLLAVEDLSFQPKGRAMPRHSIDDLTGEYYLRYLQNLHKRMRPRTYLEIGTRSGDSLALAECASIAIDPTFGFKSDVVGQKPICLFFQLTSDDFFRDFEPTRLFGGSIDFAFLDGLHLFEFLLRDFINTEKNCRSDSIIAMHDCIPSDVYIAERTDNPERRRDLGSKPGWWTGDVWKLAPILKRWRPDLSLTALDCRPTGLLLATGLDPYSTLLVDHYDEIVEEFMDVDLTTYGLSQLYAELEVQSAAEARLPVSTWRAVAQEAGVLQV